MNQKIYLKRIKLTDVDSDKNCVLSLGRQFSIGLNWLLALTPLPFVLVCLCAFKRQALNRLLI